MESIITNHHTHYRYLGSRENVTLATSRLTRVTQEAFAGQLSAALDVAFANDPAVYVLREVNTKVGLNLAEMITDAQLCQQWAKQVAKNIRYIIATASSDHSGLLVRFEDQGDYVTRFIVDVLNDQAWQRWYYQPFAYLKPRSRVDAIQIVLSENRDWQAQILARLYQLGMLDKFLQTLDMATVRQLWRQGAAVDGQATPEMVRPLFGQAIDLLDRLDLWRQPKPDQENLFLAYLATNPDPADWRDRRGLSYAVIDIVRFFVQQHTVQFPANAEYFRRRLTEILPSFDWLDLDVVRDALWQLSYAEPNRIRLLIARVIAFVDANALWSPASSNRSLLATTYLSARRIPFDQPDAIIVADIVQYMVEQGYLPMPLDAATVARLGSSTDNPISTNLPTRPTDGSLTPRQTQLLTDLREAIQAEQIQLPSLDRASAHNALRLYAVLVHYNPAWGHDSLAPVTIRILLTAWQAIGWSTEPDRTLRALQYGQLTTVLMSMPEEQRGPATEAIKKLFQFGQLGRDIIHTLSTRSRSETAAVVSLTDPAVDLAANETIDPTIESKCAGLFLLLRGLLDAQLPGLLQQTAYPNRDNAVGNFELTNLSTFLISLGLRWGGDDTQQDGRLDPGLLRFAGLTSVPKLTDIQQFWQTTTIADHRRFQAALLRTLAGQRLIRGETLTLFRLPLPDQQTALIVGGDSGQVWPLGEIIEAETQIEPLLEIWAARWLEATGYQPQILTDDETILNRLSLSSSQPSFHVRALNTTSDAEQYRLSQQALMATLTSLAGGQLGLPQVDLTMALTANALLRIWARWLRQFSNATADYLLTNFIRRSGTILSQNNHLYVKLANGALDIVLEVAGYLATLEQIAWLNGCHIHFEAGEL